MQNVDQLHAHNYHQNVTELQATEYHTKSTHIYNTGTVSQALVSFPCSRERGERAWFPQFTHRLNYPQSVETRPFLLPQGWEWR